MTRSPQPSQLPFGWVCFSNETLDEIAKQVEDQRLNCLSAGSVSLTLCRASVALYTGLGLNCLSAGSVSLTRRLAGITPLQRFARLNCLSAGSVSLTSATSRYDVVTLRVSIAFRLGLFL